MADSDVDVFAMSKQELDSYPDGVITLDRNGNIKRYNKAEANLSRREAESTIGLSFFRDVAPCTAVRSFKGRFDEFAKHQGAAIEQFEFDFKFAWGAQRVGITMVRKAGVDDINILVSVKSTAAV